MAEEQPIELTVKQVAKELQVHEKTVYDWIKLKELPAVDLGSAKKHIYRVSRVDLDTFKSDRRTMQ